MFFEYLLIHLNEAGTNFRTAKIYFFTIQRFAQILAYILFTLTVLEVK